MLYNVLWFIQGNGNLYSFGSNSESQLGLGENTISQHFNVPQKIPIEFHEWKMLDAGAAHSCALTSNYKHFII